MCWLWDCPRKTILLENMDHTLRLKIALSSCIHNGCLLYACWVDECSTLTKQPKALTLRLWLFSCCSQLKRISRRDAAGRERSCYFKSRKWPLSFLPSQIWTPHLSLMLSAILLLTAGCRDVWDFPGHPMLSSQTGRAHLNWEKLQRPEMIYG